MHLREIGLLPAVVIFFFGIASASADLGLPDCRPDMPVGTLCQKRLSELRPTQPDIGRFEVEEKVRRLRGLSEADLKAVIRQKTAPVIVGPDQHLYLTDHHHTFLAFFDVDAEYGQVIILENWATLGAGKAPAERMKLFWERMWAEHQCWPYLESGQWIDPQSPRFSKTLEACGNNDLRSLVYELRGTGLVEKKIDAHHYEFRIAQVLYAGGVRVKPGSFPAAVVEAEKYLRSPLGRQAMNRVHCELSLEAYSLGSDED